MSALRGNRSVSGIGAGADYAWMIGRSLKSDASLALETVSGLVSLTIRPLGAHVDQARLAADHPEGP